ncbi:hypothetical protein VTP01DRAFT_515 [Rhizomucor pusillus]|uniref:uncharacterized protein n=1 Tax=Rhizomucor pusillus TaxID=4840 RepID=UPI0037440A33
MEDTSLQLTVDLGQQILSKLSHLNSHQITVNWDLGPNVTRAVKYLAAALVICKTIESATNMLTAWATSRKPKAS